MQQFPCRNFHLTNFWFSVKWTQLGINKSLKGFGQFGLNPNCRLKWTSSPGEKGVRYSSSSYSKQFSQWNILRGIELRGIDTIKKVILYFIYTFITNSILLWIFIKNLYSNSSMMQDLLSYNIFMAAFGILIFINVIFGQNHFEDYIVVFSHI